MSAAAGVFATGGYAEEFNLKKFVGEAHYAKKKVYNRPPLSVQLAALSRQAAAVASDDGDDLAPLCSAPPTLLAEKTAFGGGLLAHSFAHKPVKKSAGTPNLNKARSGKPPCRHQPARADKMAAHFARKMDALPSVMFSGEPKDLHSTFSIGDATFDSFVPDVELDEDSAQISRAQSFGEEVAVDVDYHLWAAFATALKMKETEKSAAAKLSHGVPVAQDES